MPFSCTVLLDDVIKGLEKEKSNSEKVLRGTVNDFRSRAPAWITKGVRSEYNISKDDIKEALSVQSKGSAKLGGHTVDNASLIYHGRPLSYTHFGMEPTERPKNDDGDQNNTGNKKTKKKPKPYKIKVKVMAKGKKKVLKGKPFYRGMPFLFRSGGKGTMEIPFQRAGTRRLPIEPLKTLSIPQMIQDGNGDLKPEVDKLLMDGVNNRFKHYLNRYIKK